MTSLDLNSTTIIDRQHERAMRFAQVMEQYASVLCLRSVKVRTVPFGMAPAWSTADSICFNESEMADLGSSNTIVSMKGLSLHECSHILFTPRKGTEIARWVRANDLHRYFNMLEDQRIETMIVGRFGDPVIPWLTATVIQHIMKDPKSIEYAFPLVRGRKYLPLELRQLARDSFASPKDLKALSRIIDEYRLLIFPSDTEKAKDLIREYASILKMLPIANDPQKGGFPDPFGHKNRDEDQIDGSDSQPLSDKNQKTAQDRASKRNEIDEEISDAEKDLENSNGSNADDSEGDDAAPTPGDDPAKSENGSDDSDSDSDGSDSDQEGCDLGSKKSDRKSDQNGSNGASDGSENDDQDSDPTPSIDDLLNDLLNDAMDQIENEIANDAKNINGDPELEGNNSATPRKATYHTSSIDPMTIEASRRFGTELENLKTEFDPAWIREQSEGKINVARFLRGCDLEIAFDKFDEGIDDAVEIEAVICVDNSGSMSGAPASNAYRSLWAIKRALDQINARCTVITYSDSAEILYEAEERVSTVVKDSGTKGGTNPLDATLYSTRVFAESSKPVRIYFNITDGEWGSSSIECENEIKKMRDSGVLTALAFVSENQPASIDAHNCEITSSISNTSDLLPLARKIVQIAIARNLSRA
jgi:hypothetical protein